MLEIVPLVFAEDMPVALRDLRQGAPTFYVAPFDDMVQDDSVIARGALISTSEVAYVGALFQDGMAVSPFSWIQLIAARLQGSERSAWAAQEDVYQTSRLRVVDHLGGAPSPLSFVIQLRRDVDLGVEQEWASPEIDARSDLELAIADAPLVARSEPGLPPVTFNSLYAPPPGRHFAVRWQGDAPAGDEALPVHAMYESGQSAEPGDFLSIDPTGPSRRTLQVLELAKWFARNPPSSKIARFRTSSRIEPLIDGIPTYKRLMEDLDAVRAPRSDGVPVGAHFAGWAFNDFQLVPGRERTTLPEIIEDILANGGSVRLLANKFIQLRHEDVPTLRKIAIMVLLTLTDASLFITFLKKLTAEDTIFLFLAITIIASGGVLLLSELAVPEEWREESTDLVEAVNSGPEPIAIFAYNPANLDDNPLTVHFPGRLFGLQEDVDRFGTWHSKIQLVKRGPATDLDGHVGYLGGIDINIDRVDSPSHQLARPLHDVHARITGPAVSDVFQSFHEGWQHNSAFTPSAPAPVIAPPDAATLARSDSLHIAKIGRTYYGPNPSISDPPFADFAPQGERTIYDTLILAIGSARDYIYIEDQYFTPNDEFIDALVSAASRCRRLLIMLPSETDQFFGDRRRRSLLSRLLGTATDRVWWDRMFVGFPQRRPKLVAANRVASRGRCNLLQACEAGDGAIFVGPPARIGGAPFWLWIDGELMLAKSVENAYVDGQPAKRINVIREAVGGVQLGSRARWHGIGAPVTMSQVTGIYAHAKCMMIDDVFVSIGSTNLSRRGFFHDTEINVFAVPQQLKAAPDNPARALRTALWAEHLGLPPAVGAALLGDPVAAFDLFLRSRFVSRLAPLAASDVQLELGFTSVQLSLMSILELAGLTAVEELFLDNIWNLVIDPTSYTDPDREPGP